MTTEAGEGRLVSLDAFRGAIMMLMVLVNTPGDGGHVYAPLQHAEWHGWTPTDVVFPSFVWIVGVAMTLSLARRVARGVARPELVLQMLRRAAILFALGVAIYVSPNFSLSTQRILGVLQRIAICYAAAGAIYLTTGVRGQIAWIVGLLGGYWALMAFAPVPGYGAGRLDIEGNFAHYIDRIVLGSHNYIHTKTWDPEGIVSTLPAIATALLGVMAGHILRLQETLARRSTRLLLIGCALLLAGSICDTWLPINKKLWTSSFTLFMAGLDFVVFAGFLWVVDVRGWQKGAKPLVIMGMNAIAIYMASEIGDELLSFLQVRDWIYTHCFTPLANPVNASLLYAVAYTASMYGIAYWMYRRSWFLRV